MRFLVENFPLPSINILTDFNYEVDSISKISPGVSDVEVIKRAQKTNAIILTFDKDYGELIFRYSIDLPPAVIFFRFKGNDPSFAGTILRELIVNQGLDLRNAFTVIEKDSVRQRKYD
jgi:predicted nuclease of predicted toxin-antitoxin system